MMRDYDIFEKFPDGSMIWRACVFGRDETHRKLRELAECSPNEFVAIDIHVGEPLPAIVYLNNSRANCKAKQTNRLGA
jgi:hypothetical protein